MELSGKLGFLLLVAVAINYATAQTTTNYCDSALCFGKSGSLHPGCNSTAQFPSTCSANARIIEMTTERRNLILRTHNVMRNKIAAGIGALQPAAKMATMQWDDELARLAVLRSYRCSNKHDKCRGTPSFLWAGQNAAYTNFDSTVLANINITKYIIQHMDFWYSKHQTATMADINSFRHVTPSVAAFTALAQEKANRIGCAILQHVTEGKGQQVLTCNYSYINIVGRRVYAPGTAASQCATGKNPNFLNLCSLAEQYDVNFVPDYDPVTHVVKIT